MKNNLSFLLILLFLFSNNFSIAKDKKHPKINEGFMYNTYPCCEGKEHFRKIKSKNHPFWNGVPIPKTLNKRKIPSISFTDSFNYNNINELDANYFLAYEWSKKEYAKDIYQIKIEENGNKFLAISAENGKNTRTDNYGNISERGELWIPYIKLKDKEFWYGWRMKLAPDFENFANSNLKFHQILDQPQSSISKKCKFPKFSMDLNTFNLPGHLKIYNTWGQGSKEMGDCMDLKPFRKIERFNEIKFANKNKWITYKIGIYNTDSKNGFIHVYLDDELIYKYDGPTISYESGYDLSIINFGAYRRTDKILPIQTIYFDDLTFVADKETLDQILK